MENSDEIEMHYEKEMEKIDKDFLNNKITSKSKKSRQDLYKERLKAIREEYEKRYLKYLDGQKKILLKNKEKKAPKIKEKQALFQVKKINLKTSWSQVQKNKYEIFRFKLKIRLRKFFHSIIPKSLIIKHLKLRLLFKRISKELKEKIYKGIQSFKQGAINLFKASFEKISKIFSKLTSIFSAAIKKISSIVKLKKKNKAEEISEDQKIAERILGKGS